jgi:hypothetical protein
MQWGKRTMMTVIATVVREDMVLNDTLAGISESNAETTDESDTEENVEDIFTTTRSGRTTINWRIPKYK